jgi:hypothetical protein
MAANATLAKILADIARKDRHGRQVLLPSDVVRVARAPDHPLHSRFEWDDTKAAHKWRVEFEQSPGKVVKVHAYHHVREAGPGYYDTETIVRHESLRAALVREMTEDIRQLSRRLRQFRDGDKALRVVRGGMATTLRGLRQAKAG